MSAFCTGGQYTRAFVVCVFCSAGGDNRHSCDRGTYTTFTGRARTRVGSEKSEKQTDERVGGGEIKNVSHPHIVLYLFTSRGTTSYDIDIDKTNNNIHQWD